MFVIDPHADNGVVNAGKYFNGRRVAGSSPMNSRRSRGCLPVSCRELAERCGSGRGRPSAAVDAEGWASRQLANRSGRYVAWNQVAGFRFRSPLIREISQRSLSGMLGVALVALVFGNPDSAILRGRFDIRRSCIQRRGIDVEDLDEFSVCVVGNLRIESGMCGAGCRRPSFVDLRRSHRYRRGYDDRSEGKVRDIMLRRSMRNTAADSDAS